MRAPEHAHRSSVRPAPMRPAIPTTSPARTDTLRSRPLCGPGRGARRSNPRSGTPPGRAGLAGRVEAREVAADHAADQALLLHLAAAHVDRLDGPPVAQDGGGVRDRCDLVELVRIMMQVMPRDRRRRNRSRRWAESTSFSAAVGSSRMSETDLLDKPWRSRPAAVCRRRAG